MPRTDKKLRFANAVFTNVKALASGAPMARQPNPHRESAIAHQNGASRYIKELLLIGAVHHTMRHEFVDGAKWNLQVSRLYRMDARRLP